MARLCIPADQLGAGPLALTGEEYHYLVRVLRLRAGDAVELFDGQGRRAHAVIAQLTGRVAELAVEAPIGPVPVPRPQITVVQGLIKNERLDWCVQKLAELGVAHLIPVHCERCTVRAAPARFEARRSRLQAIARAAAAQSRGLWLTRVHPITELTTALTSLCDVPHRVLLWEEGASPPLFRCLPASAPSAVALVIGPEGGFTPAEVQYARDAGFTTAGLGATILRSETAAVVAAAITAHLLGTPESAPAGPPRRGEI